VITDNFAKATAKSLIHRVRDFVYRSQ